MNNLFLVRAEQWLTELGIHTQAASTCLMVNRLDVDNFTASGQQANRDEIIGALRETISPKLHWGYVNNEWLYLESF